VVRRSEGVFSIMSAGIPKSCVRTLADSLGRQGKRGGIESLTKQTRELRDLLDPVERMDPLQDFFDALGGQP